MHPCRTAFIGLLLFGLAHAQEPQEATYLNSRLYAQGDIPDLQGDSPYWWMNKGSPFKRSYSSGQQQFANNDNGYPGSKAYQGGGGGGQLDVSNNPFLGGKPFEAASSNTGFGAASNSVSSAYAAPGYLPPDETVRTISCTERNQVCVTKYLCRNGFVDSALTEGSKQTCNADNEICCTVREAPPPTAAPTQPPRPVQPQTTPCADKNYGCVSPDQCVNGVSNGFQSKQPTQKCFAPEVCCRFLDQSPSPNQILPEVRPTPRPYPSTPSEVLTSEGYVITVPETKFPVQQTTQRPTQRPYQPPAQTPRPYQPPAQTPRPYQPPAQTPRPYQPPAPQQTPRPYQPAPQTQRPPFKGEEYIPPTDNHIGSPSNERPVNYLPPVERGEDLKSEPIEPRPNPSNTNQVSIRPNQQGDDAAPEPPTQCPAATNCTEIQFCSAQGVISKTVVQLSPEQEAFRVPLSDCRSLDKGYIGKCCRDPDYVDPWPVGILGQYNASILGFDDGSYKPPSSNGRPAGRTNGNGPNSIGNGNRPNNGPNANGPNGNRPNGINPSVPNGNNNPNGNNGNPPNNGFPSGPAPIRGQEQLSLPIAGIDGSQSQTTFTRTPFPQAVTNQLNYQRQKDTPYTVEPIASGSGICAVRDINSLPKGVGPFDAGFGEFPWQAMILKESTKSLLCGGAIIQADTILTAANCVKGVKPYDVLIKGGEWKLGSDEEPRPFQTIRVKSISFHPEYQSYGRDVALLHLENGLKFDKHIAPICIDEQDFTPTPGKDECLCTGWGKDALKVHAQDAVMHQIPISPVDQSECSQVLPGFNPSTSVCGRPQQDACQADVGSALACQNGDGNYLLKGVYSTETQCNNPSQIVTFAKMDVKWIKENMHGPAPGSAPRQQLNGGPQPNGRPYVTQKLPEQQPSTSQVTYSLQSTQAPSYLPPRN